MDDGSAPRIAAFFDVDNTLLAINSAVAWVRHRRRTGAMGLYALGRSIVWLARYKLGSFDFDAVAAREVPIYKGVDVGRFERELAAWFDAEIAAHICPAGVERIAYHRAQGHLVALLTSGTRFSVDPLARRLGVEHVLCTELEEEGGALTGRHLPPACGGPGKVVHAERFAKAHGVDLDESFFYTDSYSDLPMLERVGKPRIINPDARLRRWARAQGWGYERWTAT
ncbi:MAG: HAD family hydrolase [Nannocystaceae bacterium]|nr:HAD family hydrolase [Myxococcales bacterium]